MIARDNIDFRITGTWGFTDQHIAIARDDQLGIEWHKITNKKSDGFSFCKPRNYFYIKGVEREFTDLDELVDAYNDKFQFEGENPDYEIKWVRVVKKRGTTRWDFATRKPSKTKNMEIPKTVFTAKKCGGCKTKTDHEKTCVGYTTKDSETIVVHYDVECCMCGEKSKDTQEIKPKPDKKNGKK